MTIMATIYRKYRPQTFDEVYGQEHILETLKQALKLNRVAHAYLFSGARGVGKTTVARLLAKAVNCLDEKVKPCGKCANCLAIQENRFIDLIEIDAASNRGIDEIRQLRDKIQFSPSVGKKRVYIIDEVHMLTREAFNALLKTLEEPPEHTIFIFATTEAHKVPVTVLSRCQRFDFRLGGEELVKKSLKEIAKREKLKLDDKIIDLLVRTSGGSFRDAQSLLDQLSSRSIESDLSYEDALALLNLSSVAEVENFIALLKESDGKSAIEFIESLKEKGVSFPDFLAQLIIELRRKLIEKIKADEDSLWENRALKRLMLAEADMKFAPVESLPLELASYEVCVSTQNTEYRIQNTEEKRIRKNTEYKIENTEKKSENSENKKLTRNSKLKTQNSTDDEEKPAPEIIPITRDIKHAVVMEVSGKNKTLGALLADLSWEGDSSEVKIIAQYTLHKNMITNKKNLLILENCLQSVLQCKSKVTCVIKKEEDIAEEIDSVFGEDG